MMIDDLSKRSGQTVYVAGGAGGVGHFAVQLCKAYGLKVIASASKPASIDLLKSFGVIVIDYSRQDVIKEILGATGGKGVDLVYDSTYSESSFKQSAAVVASGGRWIRLGSFEREPGCEDLVKGIVGPRGGKYAFGDLGRYWGPEFSPKLDQIRNGLAQAVRLYGEGKVKPSIAATVPFDAAAVSKALGESKFGKVVVKIAN